MKEFQGKKAVRRKIYSWPILIVLFILSLAMFRGIWSAYEKVQYAKKKAIEAQTELHALQVRAKELSLQVSREETKKGQEEEFREKFLVGKEGEGVIFLVEPSSTTKIHSSKEEASVWTRFLRLF